jgi:hypothetical protein
MNIKRYTKEEKRMTFWGGFTIGALVVGVLCALEVAIFRFFIITECS